MKRALIVAAALGLLLPDVAMAQQGPPPRQGGPQGGGHPSGGHPGGPPGRPAGHPPSGGHAPGARPMPGHAAPGHAMYGHPMYGAARPVPTYVRPLPPRGNEFWHRGRYYPRIHAPPFAYPRGWGYRQWYIGAVLPPLLFAPAYFYPGWATLGLQAPAPGYQWVRYGPDLLLVNLGTGEVEDVVYGAFQ